LIGIDARSETSTNALVFGGDVGVCLTDGRKCREIYEFEAVRADFKNEKLVDIPYQPHAFEKSWEQRINRMIAGSTPIEVAWRPGGEEQKDFIWPLPFDFTPTNDAALTAGTDGYPLGDLNWFGKDVVEAWENGWPLPVEALKMKSMELKLGNYPNPFSSNTHIRYDLPARSHVTLKIYDITGSEVAILVNETQVAGHHEMMFDGANLSGGIYFCKIKAGNTIQLNKMILIK
jgi:hypothetical protein